MSFRSAEAIAADAAAQPQVVTNTAISSPGSGQLRQEVEAFLRVPLPSTEVGFEKQVTRFLGQSDMEGLMLERPPFFFIERAVAIGDHTVFGLARMTAERCAGHFPAKPIVPLIELCKAMAQTGIILASLHAKPNEVPIAIGSGESKARAKELIRAPVDVLIKVTLQGARLKLYFADGIAYVAGQPIGSLAKIVYTLVPRELVGA